MSPFTPEMTSTDYMYQEKKGEEDLPALKIALTYQYDDSKTTLNWRKKD